MMRVEAGRVLRNGVIAGAAGGLAEVVWVSVYAALTGVDPASVARAVTTAAGVARLLPAAPATLGIAVHMGLALLLGIALASVWERVRRHAPAMSPYGIAIPALVAVWAFNFFVLLPVIDAGFVQVLPYMVSLASKLLFGLAAAEVLRATAQYGTRERMAARAQG